MPAEKKTVLNHRADQHAAEAVKGQRNRLAWVRALTAVPAAVLPLLPSFACPVCLAAYAGVLSSLGLGFLFSDRVQAPLIVFFLTITLGSVAWSAKQHRRFGPLLVVLCGSLAIVVGRVVWDIRWALYLGVVCLVVGTVWNLILKRPRRKYVPLGFAQDRSTTA